MNYKYKKYIDYIAKDLEAPYFKNMRDSYGLRPEEYNLVLSKVFNQTVSIMGRYVYNEQGSNICRIIYWQKWEYEQGHQI